MAKSDQTMPPGTRPVSEPVLRRTSPLPSAPPPLQLKEATKLLPPDVAFGPPLIVTKTSEIEQALMALIAQRGITTHTDVELDLYRRSLPSESERALFERVQALILRRPFFRGVAIETYEFVRCVLRTDADQRARERHLLASRRGTFSSASRQDFETTLEQLYAIVDACAVP